MNENKKDIGVRNNNHNVSNIIKEGIQRETQKSDKMGSSSGEDVRKRLEKALSDDIMVQRIMTRLCNSLSLFII